ncbi:protein kinase domain-containing protein [Streptosporangium sandarakinum]|uniref:protein kinase domain-containing protein n=2 Tax=Streptosporangium sandarakinum TaxID=1260955 RepID=UPI0036A0A6D6
MAEAQPEGRRVASRYHLLEPIGRGGMGIVWRAHDELLDREVAVKEVRYADTLGEDNQENFNRRTKREARAAGRLTHPNVVVVHDVVEEDGRPWIVMQLVESRSLGKVLRQDGPLPPERVAEIGLQVLDALRAAHAQGVLHRDVKPENVLLADDGRVVLTDFGIATLEAETALTMTGIAGTPAFIAPERIKGGSAQRESDLWSLGATLYAAVEGRAPHDRGGALPTMHAVLNDEPDPPVRAGRLAPVLEGLLRKDPARRLSYDEAERMLREVAEGGRRSAPAGESREPARTTVMPVAETPDAPEPRAAREARESPDDAAAAATDPQIRLEAGGAPSTGARLGTTAPAEEEDVPSVPAPAPPAAPAPTGRAPSAKAGREPVPPVRRAGPDPAPAARPEREPGPREAVPAPRPEPVVPPARREPAARPRPSAPPTVSSAASAASSAPPTVPPSAAPDMLPTSPGNGGRSGSALRWALLIVPAILLVGALAAWLGMRSAENDGGSPAARAGRSAEPAGTSKTSEASRQPTSDPTSSGSPGSGESPSAAPSPSPSASETGGEDDEKEKKKDEPALPAGWRMHKDPNGFSIGLPKGWHEDKRVGKQVWFRSPDRVSFVFVEYVDKAGPDPKEDWENQESYSRGRFPGYKRIRIENTDYMEKAADWEFTWNTSSGKARVINRGFVTKGGRGYAIYWHTLDSKWDENLHYFKGFTESFSSKK